MRVVGFCLLSPVSCLLSPVSCLLFPVSRFLTFSSNTVYKGRISEINPVIGENGLILVKAEVKNPGPLMDGMNVRILIEKQVPDQMVVPKSAVLLRDNQEVLFRCTHDSIAFWTYIQTTGENTTSYSVIAHPDKGATLEAGDTVIVSGNLNLAHESKVHFDGDLQKMALE